MAEGGNKDTSRRIQYVKSLIEKFDKGTEIEESKKTAIVAPMRQKSIHKSKSAGNSLYRTSSVGDGLDEVSSRRHALSMDDPMSSFLKHGISASDLDVALVETVEDTDDHVFAGGKREIMDLIEDRPIVGLTNIDTPIGNSGTNKAELKFRDSHFLSKKEDKSDQETKIQGLSNQAKRIRDNLKSGIFLMNCEKQTPINILIIGMTGVGKSSLTNSLLMAINPNGYTDLAHRGFYGVGGKDERAAITLSIEPIHLFQYMPQRSIEREYIGQPYIYDFPGLENEDDKRITELIRMAMKGKVEAGTNLNAVLRKGAKDFEKKMKKLKADESRKIHVVIFVHAITDPMPEELMKCVREALRPDKQGEHVYLPLAVITKIDQLTAQKQKEIMPRIKKELSEGLGIGGLEERVFATSLYCHKVSEGLERNEGIDKSMCQIWNKILRPENFPYKSKSKGQEFLGKLPFLEKFHF